MAEYIDRDAVYHAISVDGGLNAYEKAYCIDVVRKISKEDADMVRHGYWSDYGFGVCCSNCGVSLFHQDENDNLGIEPSRFYFCPYCGARMDGGDKNDE